MLKRLITLGALLLGASFAQANDAPLCTEENMDGCALTLTGGPPDSPVQCSSEPQIIVYTVHNDAFDDVDLDPIIDTLIDDTSPGSTVEIDEGASSCFNTMPPSVPAQDECTLTVIITPVDCPLKAKADGFPQYIVRDLLPQADVNQTPLVAHINVTVNGELADFLTALPGINQGEIQSTGVATGRPLLVTRTSDSIWEDIDTSAFTSGEFKSATCTGTDDEGVCIAVGTGYFAYSTSPSTAISALIYSSQDGGNSWNIPNTDPSHNGVYNSVSCTNEGDDSGLCAAGGAPSSPGDAIATVTIDGGVNWIALDDSSFGTGYWTDTACTDLNSANGFCAYVGQFTSGGEIGFLTFSKKQLQITEKESASPEVAANEIYFATACAGTNAVSNSTACTMVGTDSDTTYAVLKILANGTSSVTCSNDPVNWNTQVPGTFYDTACAKTISNEVVCTAVGQTLAGDSMLYVNTDVTSNINNWTAVETPADAILLGTACESNATRTACIAVGSEDDGDPLLYVNTDVAGAGTWDLINAPEGTFNGAACTRTATGKLACTIAGVDPNNAPLIFTSPDVVSGYWGTPTTTPPLSIDGCLNGAGASGANSNIGCSDRPTDFLIVLPGSQGGSGIVQNQVSSFPLLGVHTASGLWENIDTSIDYSNGQFISGTCTGDDNEGICIAVGSGHLDDDDACSTSDTTKCDPERAIIYVSQDGGNSWGLQNSPTTLAEGVLNSVACTNSGDDTATCFAVGTPFSSNPAIAYFSINGGKDWIEIDVSPFGNGYFVDIACTDDVFGGVCVTAGQFESDGGLAFYFTFGTTKTQTLKAMDANVPNPYLYNATACAQNYGTTAASCTVVGTDEDTGFARLLVFESNTGTFTPWTLEVVGELFDTACTLSDGKVVCTAVGESEGNSLLYVNKDVLADINNWVPVETATNGHLDATACDTNSDGTTVCIASGVTEGQILLYVNTNVTGLNSQWNQIETPPTALFFGAACTVTAEDKIACAVAGGDFLGDYPVVFSTSNAFTNVWGVPLVTPPLPGEGYFNGAGAGGANSNDYLTPDSSKKARVSLL